MVHIGTSYINENARKEYTRYIAESVKRLEDPLEKREKNTGHLAVSNSSMVSTPQISSEYA